MASRKEGFAIPTVMVMAILAAFFMLAVSLILGVCFMVFVISMSMMHCRQGAPSCHLNGNTRGLLSRLAVYAKILPSVYIKSSKKTLNEESNGTDYTIAVNT